MTVGLGASWKGPETGSGSSLRSRVPGKTTVNIPASEGGATEMGSLWSVPWARTRHGGGDQSQEQARSSVHQYGTRGLFFKLEDNCFTMLCCFLLYCSMNQP